MQSFIRVTNLENKTSWEKHLTSPEFEEIKICIDNKKNFIGYIPALFQPIRTNNFKNFSKDFFLPTFINHAIKVQNIVGKIFAILLSLVTDILTFPIRLLTVIPRFISNSNAKENSFRKYLVDQNVNEKVIEADSVRVFLQWKAKDPLSYTEYNGKRKYDLKTFWSEDTFNFIELPPLFTDLGMQSGTK